ncbi:MAG: IS110 family transposase [Cyclobacteriaceae bacterium]|nr:IS110 family transposase [Cyclobacteriaceae bacterium]MCK5279056.1 IS110 family transposase [Cyclobacteriaceae bacterium]MCK5468255.1 IS110 family transposase [Cyclobacteriaceae bacterium]
MDKSKQLDFSGQNIYVGLDTHLKNWRVSIMVGENAFKTFSQDPRPELLKSYLVKNFPGGNYHSAYEASFCGFTIHRELKRLGIENIVVNPADIPTTDKERKQKEDSRDSRKIARELSKNDLKAIHVPEVELESDRHFIRYRKTLTKEIVRTKQRIKAHLYYFGIEIPDQFSGGKCWTKRFTAWLQEIKLPVGGAKMTMRGHMEMAEMLRKKQLSTTKAIRKLAEKECYKENYHLLLSIPGIGCLTAMIILTEIGDIKRFKNLDKLCCFIGLVPMTNSTGENERTGDITVRRSEMLRKTIVESSWIAIRCDPALMLAYQKLIKRMEPQKAIIRIAKKLTNRIMSVLKNKVAYEYGVVK